MKIILANFDNVLGLNGSLNFIDGKPLLIYGENIAGKSNIINTLRYCLIPKWRRKRGYAEEKRLKKNEILLEKNSAGSVEIYFEQRGKLYKLRFYFSRKQKNVSQTQRIFESNTVKLSIEDDERIQTLKKLEWKDLGASTLKLLKEKLIGIGIYPEILDILISPSNVRNFSEAIDGSVVRVPEIIATRISKMNVNARKYSDNLKKLHGVIVLEREEFEKRIMGLRKEFEDVSKNLPEINPKEIFVPGKIAENLENIWNTLSKQLESMPEKASEMKETLTLLSSEKYDIWICAINNIVAVTPKKEELKVLLEKLSNFKNVHETLRNWEVTFEHLPPDSNPEGLSSFDIPKYAKFNFGMFSNPERIKSIFLFTEEAKSLLQKATKISDKHGVQPKFSEINNMIKSYDRLFRTLKKPSEPKGDSALISKRQNKIIVSIPLDIALAKMDYLRGIEPMPFIHRPEKLDEKKFKEKVSRVQSKISTFGAELREAKKSLSQAKKLLKKAKQLRQSLSGEIRLLEDNMKRSEKDLDKLLQKWKNAYHHLCEVFKLSFEEIDLSSKDAVEASSGIILRKYKKAQEIFERDLIRQLKKYPETIEKIQMVEELTPTDIVKRVTEEFEKKIEEMTSLQQEYKKVSGWILSNSNQIESLENRNRTREIMTISLAIAQEFLTRIHEKSDIKRIVEELADKLEENVRDVYSKVFPEDEAFNFEHLKEGQFLSTIANEPITHPSGSQRVAISAGIMLSLAETFGLPIILDEAFDRIDVNRLKFFSEYITGIAGAPNAPHICLAGYTTFNIEKNPEVLRFVNNWKIYLVKRTEVLAKNIHLLKEISALD
ncbi:MAG: AAA family ATPase [Candidatus Bathyarchaeota archaeon]|nr:AAA family ATPase [Candidatus Bathyarchaeota archaeon]